jgi:hypothetical protein
MQNYCSPSHYKNFNKRKSCYDVTTLRKIAEAYNRHYPTNTVALTTRTGKVKAFNVLWKELQTKLRDKCDTDETCWVAHVGIKNDINVRRSLRPEKPIEWNKNPTEWLSNFDIEEVLIQYEAAHAPFYKFFGVYPSNFLRKVSSNATTCAHNELCNIDIAKLYNEGVRTFGMIINLDKHDEPGSHWTSLFVCIDPALCCFGAYYYDSTAHLPPPDMTKFMKDICSKSKAIATNVSFKIRVNKIKQQYKGSECGVFAIYNQLKWLGEIKSGANKRLTFDKIVDPKVNDDKMTALRDRLFRPTGGYIKK